MVASSTLALLALASSVLAHPATSKHSGHKKLISPKNPQIVHPTPPGKVTPKTLKHNKVKHYKPHPQSHAANGAAGPATPVNTNIINTLGGNVTAYITGADSNGALCFVQTDGTCFYPPNPSAAGTPIPAQAGIPLNPTQGSTTTVPLTVYLSSARAYAAAGGLQFFINPGPGLVQPSINAGDPNAGTNWGFAEFTYAQGQNGGPDTMNINVSAVDFVGLPVGYTVDGDSTNSVPGVPADGVAQVCSGLQDQSNSDGQPWDTLCQSDSSGNLLRAVSAENIPGGPDAAFGDYFTQYVQNVYNHYTNDATLSIKGNSLTVNGNGALQDADGNTYAQPNIVDILGCNSGPFVVGSDQLTATIVPPLCAAFNRATFLLDGGDNQPAGPGIAEYYTTSPCNHYSRVVHSVEIGGLGYAFAYDDVDAPDGTASGFTITNNPTTLTFTAGGPSS